jgi:predicted nucleotidyltransferase
MRKDSFKALVGSHNYNLQTPESDRDYKIFFFPSFSDLYSGEKYSKAKTSDNEDIEYHDIRKLPDMLWKSNVNFLEVLFSQEVHSDDTLYEKLHNRREEIARMNLPYLYDACMGMFYKKFKEFQRDRDYVSFNESSEEQQKKMNKHAMAAYRILDFLFRYQDNEFTSFQEAIYYSNEDDNKEFLFDIKKGKIHEIEGRLNTKKMLTEELKSKYKNKGLDEITKFWIYELVKEKVRGNILEELQ